MLVMIIQANINIYNNWFILVNDLETIQFKLHNSLHMNYFISKHQCNTLVISNGEA